MAVPTNRESTRFSSLLVKAMRTDAQSVAKVPVTIKGVAGQTANLLELQDSTGAVLYRIDSTGRGAINATSKTIIDSAATSLVDVACAASAMVGGNLHYVVRATDGTDFQALSGFVTYSGVNKAATITGTVTELATNQAKTVSAGTLTLAWTIVAGANKLTIKVQPTGSLTETTPYDITFTISPIVGAVTVL